MRQQKYDLFGEQGAKQLLPFYLVMCCFFLWGFANDMTPAVVSAFSKVFGINASQGGLINVANALGFFVMGIPAAILIQKYKFKTGVLVGLCVYAVGALLFLPSKAIGTFTPFLFSYFIITCGLAFLQTTCSPLVYSMGSEESGIGRLNLAMTFNTIGALLGMFIFRNVVQAGMSPLSNAQRSALPPTQFEIVKEHDLSILIQPYVYIVAFIVLLIVLIRIQDQTMPNDTTDTKDLWQRFLQICKVRNYQEAVIAQCFYVGAQVGCWAYIIQYGVRIFMIEGITETDAEMLSQKYNIAAIAMFAVFRLLCTWLLKFFYSEHLLSVMSIIAITFTIGAILFTDRDGLYCLIVVSACMSLMFPTINGIGLRGMGSNVKLASAGFTMAVIGGAIFPALQAAIIDTQVTVLGLPATNISFIIPLICFVVVAIFGHRAYVRHYIMHDANNR